MDGQDVVLALPEHVELHGECVSSVLLDVGRRDVAADPGYRLLVPQLVSDFGGDPVLCFVEAETSVPELNEVNHAADDPVEREITPACVRVRRDYCVIDAVYSGYRLSASIVLVPVLHGDGHPCHGGVRPSVHDVDERVITG